MFSSRKQPPRSAASLSMSQLIQRLFPVTSSHFITAPDVCLLGVHSLCSVLSIQRTQSSSVDLSYALKASSVLATHTLSLNDQSASLEVKREGLGTGPVKKKRRGVQCLLFYNTVWLSESGWLLSKRSYNGEHNRRKEQVGASDIHTTCSIVRIKTKTQSWHALLVCSPKNPHRSNINNLLKINKRKEKPESVLPEWVRVCRFCLFPLAVKKEESEV